MITTGLVGLALALSGVSAQTVYLAGDSTMAANGGGAGTGTDGWGQYLGQYLDLTVVNDAIGGRSARSYTDEGRFDNIINTVTSGDFVVIEFGHNDGSARSGAENGRQDAVGDDYDLTATVFDADGNAIVIHTFNYYVQNAITALQDKGAIPIILSQTPNNGWTDGSISAGPRFVGYAELAGERTSATYIDHYAYVAQAYNALGETTVNNYYPNDHTHTSPEGAEVVAEAFVRGLLCSDNDLKNHVNSAGQGVPTDGCL